jgi:hypothetical protein
MPVTFTQAEVDGFKAAMLKNPGVTEMYIGDKRYKFDTLKAMREHLAYMERNVVGGQAGRTRYGATSKGLNVPVWNDRTNTWWWP